MKSHKKTKGSAQQAPQKDLLTEHVNYFHKIMENLRIDKEKEEMEDARRVEEEKRQEELRLQKEEMEKNYEEKKKELQKAWEEAEILNRNFQKVEAKIAENPSTVFDLHKVMDFLETSLLEKLEIVDVLTEEVKDLRMQCESIEEKEEDDEEEEEPEVEEPEPEPKDQEDVWAKFHRRKIQMRQMRERKDTSRKVAQKKEVPKRKTLEEIKKMLEEKQNSK